jgi:hypothetical protein
VTGATAGGAGFGRQIPASSMAMGKRESLARVCAVCVAVCVCMCVCVYACLCAC